MNKPDIPFVGFSKISRWSRGVIVTEKIDGTNGVIYISDSTCECSHSVDIHQGGMCRSVQDIESGGTITCTCPCFKQKLTIYAGSRNRWIDPTDDNMGFAKWVEANQTELMKLGPGSHFGEWWGSGIQRGYGLTKGEKRFSLFNVSRWRDDAVRPACCSVVPVLRECLLDEVDVSEIMRKLKENGSYASPGFKNPEGIVVFCTAGGQLFKKTFEKDAGKEKNS